MATARRLARPPIAEALVDIRIATETAVVSSTFDELVAHLKEAYPKVEPVNRMEAKIQLGQGGPAAESHDLGFHGLFLRTSDGSKVAQFRTDGFTLNWLPPYQTAELLFDEAIRLWEMYRSVVNPTVATRIALRYINRIPLKLADGEDLGPYLTAIPPVGPGIKARVSSFLSRVVIHDDQSDNTAVVTQAMDPSAEANHQVLIDIEVFRAGESGIESDSIRRILDGQRVFKNRLFFSLVTEQTLRRFE